MCKWVRNSIWVCIFSYILWSVKHYWMFVNDWLLKVIIKCYRPILPLLNAPQQFVDVGFSSVTVYIKVIGCSFFWQCGNWYIIECSSDPRSHDPERTSRMPFFLPSLSSLSVWPVRMELQSLHTLFILFPSYSRGAL